jgi:AraC-like DNA-binding protein
MASLVLPAAKDEPVVRFSRPPHAAGLELVHYPNLTRGWRGIPETYTWFTTIDRLEGDVDVLSRGMQAPCAPHSVTIGEPGEPYVLRPRSAMRGEFRVIRVYQSLYSEIRDQIGAPAAGTPFPRAPQRDPGLTRRFDRLYRAIDGGSTLATQERLFAFLAALVDRGRRAPMPHHERDPRAVRRARELLHARFNEPLTLTELSQAAGTDRFALLRAFSHKVGMPPHAYQMHLRVARACRLIVQGVSLADVAIAVGYSEQSALHRPFVRLVGVTPGEYARVLR